MMSHQHPRLANDVRVTAVNRNMSAAILAFICLIREPENKNKKTFIYMKEQGRLYI